MTFIAAAIAVRVAEIPGSAPPGPIQDGLTFNIDCLDTASYPGTGTTWASTINSANNGTLNNGVAFNGTSMVFDGTNDNVSFPTMSNNLIQTPMTIEIWMQRDGTSGDAVVATHDNPGGYVGDGIYIRTALNRLYIYSNNQPAGSVNGPYLWDNSPGWPSGVWMQMVITIAGPGTAPPTETDILLYKNSVSTLWNSPNLYYLGPGGCASPTTDPILIGANPNGAHAFDGKIDIVRIYDRVLSPDEVTYNFELERTRFGI